MAQIRLQNITKTFGDVVAVNDMTLDVRHGEFFTLLGPPGAGKTTTLRTIVGLETPDRGRIFLDDEDVTDVYPGERDIAMIFQNLALYPNKTVFDNMAYPLRERGMERANIKKTVEEAAEKLRITRLLKRKPGQLSGGERQRVAIGRAIVRRPRAYLMDEPLSALDALLRQEMRIELKRLQLELEQTLVYVTHDQLEALSMSDRIGVLRLGVLQQVDTPDVIYNRPANRFVALNVGSPPMNFIPCEMNGLQLVHSAFTIDLADALNVPDEKQIELALRPENVTIHFEKSAEADIPATIFALEPLGAEVIVDVKVGEDNIKAAVPSPFDGELDQSVWVSLDPAFTHVLDSTTDEFVRHGDTEAPLFRVAQAATE